MIIVFGMDRATRSELVRTVQEQKEQLDQYKSRLRDVVQAYKGIIKEKEALEASVKVLSTAHSHKEERSASHKEATKSAQDKMNPQHKIQSQINSDGNTDEGPDQESLQDQIETLSSSLFTLTQEKTKLESSYIADKKRLMQENEDLNRNLEEEKERHGQKLKQAEEQIQEKLLADERTSKDMVENQLEETQNSLKEKEQVVSSISEEYEKKLQSISNELKAVKQKLKEAENKASQPSPMIKNLQTEIAEMKAQDRLLVLQEQKRANDLEDKLKQISSQSETRISSLETKLSELSEVVGNYERQRYQDEQTIQKLKERVTQLDLENTALAQASRTSDLDDDQNLLDLDSQGLADRIVKLKRLLKLANQKTGSPILFEDSEGDIDRECKLCSKYKDEFENVKEEFERYKLRAQSVLKSKSSKDNGNSKEVDALKGQINELREKLKNLHIQFDEENDKHNQKLESLHMSLVGQQENHKEELAHVESEHRHQISELEIELKKQRERTVALLAEKDREIDILKSTSQQGYENTYYSQLRNLPDSGASAEIPRIRSNSSEEEALSRLLNIPPIGQGEQSLLFYAQEQARKDVEINSLRKQKRQLESALRDLQISSSTKEESLHENIELLEEELRKRERDKSREGANLEYLKNVTYKFLTSSDPKAKQQMLNAITTILQFSPREKAVVHTHTKGWWGY
ncbi:hypothetical protein KUTeg_013756 [Tegillarca granosa]|uniref:GRIP domain-containing protein n=1 Tax=Tegillarca granosa TaxID=220873 RepID=A0ABQ9EY12_TEGGR|nr:hypothetical protein KUTeg_013756 [Tegillarca granosa]